MDEVKKRWGSSGRPVTEEMVEEVEQVEPLLFAPPLKPDLELERCFCWGDWTLDDGLKRKDF